MGGSIVKLSAGPLIVAGAGLAAIVVGLLHGAPTVHAQEESPGVPALPDLQPNSDWQEMPVAGNDGLEGRAWSDPAGGCHLALLSIPIPDSAADDTILESLGATLAKSDYRLTPSEANAEPAHLLLEGFGVRGIATLEVPQGQGRRASLLACYWNGREPTYCRSLCQTADDKMRNSTGSSEREAGQ